MTIDQFPEWEETDVHNYRQSFARVFGDKRADFIILDSRRNLWLMQAIKWAIDKELLYHAEEESARHSAEQSTVMIFRQTINGALIFGGGTNPEKGAPRYPVAGEIGERVLLHRAIEFKSAEWHNEECYRLVLEAGAQLDIVQVSKNYDHNARARRVIVRVTGTPFLIRLLDKDIEGTEPNTLEDLSL